MIKENVIILYIETIEIQLLDIPRALDELGYNVYKASLGIRAQGFDEIACERVMNAIEQYHVQYAISYDFSESIAQACFEKGIPYISWVYDAPQQELYTHYAQYPSNYIFVFDKMQQRRMQEIGIDHVYHMPLAVHLDKVNIALQQNEKTVQEYLHDISFVGQLYYNDIVEKYYRIAPEAIKKSLDKNIDSCFLKWDENTRMHGIMEEQAVAYFSEIDEHRIPRDYPYITEQFNYEAAVLSRMLANRERVHVLNTLAEKNEIAFYTFDQHVEQIKDKVHIYPGAKYDYEVSNIYQKSKINLNITLHCIETGASQRIFDVMAAGGFMLSNYQQELEELFVPGEEIVLYHNMDELEYYIEYYLSHEEERKEIARKGQQKVLRLHGFHNKLLKVMEIVGEQEEKRTESYIALQRRMLQMQAEEILSQGDKDGYMHLYHVFNEGKYETTIRKTSQLGELREMLECFRSEGIFKESHLFDDVKSLDAANKKYLRLKHGLWRIEQGISEEKCIEVVEMILDEGFSLFFVGWQIYANMCYREELYITLSNYFRTINLVMAIEFLSYALFWLKGNETILLNKADCLMEAGMWLDALQTLEQIEHPNKDVVLLIHELKSSLESK